MAEFVTADDKRIKDAQDYGPNDLLASDFLVTDRPGSPSARRQTVQRILNLVAISGLKQRATSGSINPDNAAGINGDFYFKVPVNASSLSLYEKAEDVWSLIFTVPLGIPGTNFDETDLIDLGGGNWYLPVVLSAGELVLAVSSDISGTEDQIQFSVSDGKIFGFPSNDPQTIIVKIA